MSEPNPNLAQHRRASAINNEMENRETLLQLKIKRRNLLFYMHVSAYFVGIFVTSVLLFVSEDGVNGNKGALVNEYWQRVIVGLFCGLLALDFCWLSRLKKGKEAMIQVQKLINEAMQASGRSLGERRQMGEIASDLIEDSEKIIWKLVGQRLGEQMISIALGTLFGLTASQPLMLLTLNPTSFSKLHFFLSSCALYHYGEYMYKLCYQLNNEADLTWHDFQIDHSIAYIIAMGLCLSESASRRWLLDSYNAETQGIFAWILNFAESSQLSRCLSAFGLFLMFGGHYFRIASMFHAGSNFNHLVQTHKQKGHQLVKSGPYYWFRHPSYFGWFYWAIGTQLLLSNYVCLPLWIYAAWSFFSDRIPYEEYHLVRFFGEEYTDYANETPIGIPWIEGYCDVKMD